MSVLISAPELPAQPSQRPARRLSRSTAIRWLREAHGWIGLWGALLGLLFGSSGVLLNHRAVLKIPAAQVQEDTVHLDLPQPAPANARELGQWLREELQLQGQMNRPREEPAHPVAWGDKSLIQPAHWMLSIATPSGGVQADYWVGNNYVTVKRSSNNFFATLSNLHKGVGLGVGWVLLIDTLAGSIILLSLTGLVLWVLTHKRRTVGYAILGVSTATTVAVLLLSA